MKKNLPVIIACLFISMQLFAKEGMWVPMLLGKYTISDMQKMGFRLSASDIYDINHSSMKDAVVLFGTGCTGELISGDGLLITNYHCGIGQVQSHSSVEHDYLTDGFWAMNKNEELANPRLTARILEYMEDVTGKVLAGADTSATQEGKEKAINSNIAKIEAEAAEGGKYEARVGALYYGNQYFLYVYKVFRDVRLVGAPPSSIGKFGGDTDNWMWPRHTGDFSIFRIYAGKDNQPAPYSEENVPYKPEKFFSISMKGVSPGDFTMVFGFPAHTTEYIPSKAVKLIVGQRDPDRIGIRDKKLGVIYNHMNTDPKVRIQYAAKANGISNSWKKWQGEIKGLNRLNTIAQKETFEKDFKNWAASKGEWENNYQEVFDEFNRLYAEYAPLIKADDYYSEIVFRGSEVMNLALAVSGLASKAGKDNKPVPDEIKKPVVEYAKQIWKDLDPATDKELFAVLLPELANGLDVEYLPAGVADEFNKKGWEKQIQKIAGQSILYNKEKLLALLADGTSSSMKKLAKDPIVVLYQELNRFYQSRIKPRVTELESQLDINMKKYMAGIIDMEKGNPIYPDANFTLRVSYGKVEGFKPTDGVVYNYFTTLGGIIEKDNPGVYDYNVPGKLKELYKTKDFGGYAENGTVPVCFIASNHTTGGNSGSPVLNADGKLVGINFDRCWEGTMSDVMYDPSLCRNIILDIRYALFIIDKFAGAGYLLDEMEIER